MIYLENLFMILILMESPKKKKCLYTFHVFWRLKFLTLLNYILFSHLWWNLFIKFIIEFTFIWIDVIEFTVNIRRENTIFKYYLRIFCSYPFPSSELTVKIDVEPPDTMQHRSVGSSTVYLFWSDFPLLSVCSTTVVFCNHYCGRVGITTQTQWSALGR